MRVRILSGPLGTQLAQLRIGIREVHDQTLNAGAKGSHDGTDAG